MNNYKIVFDENLLDEFIEWLPELEESEIFYFQLFARKKYLPKGTIQSGQQSLNRFACKKDRIKEKIKQLEIPLGRYLNRGIELPQECLVLYCCPNPRCHQKAAKSLLIELANRVTRPYDKYNTYQLAITEIHRSCSRKIWIDFDFDNMQWESIQDSIYSIINKDSLTVLKTRGGFHILVKLDQIEEQYKSSFYNKIKALGADVAGDDLISIPGCCHGGFIPHFVKL